MKLLIAQTSSAKEAVVNYINAANSVSEYVAGINGVAIPNLVQPPPGYGDYAANFGKVRLSALAWMEEVIPSFSLLPQSFLDFGATVQGQLQTLASELAQLSPGADTTSFQQSVQQAVAVLQKELKVSQRAVTDLDGAIARYAASLAPDAETLTSFAKEMLTAEGADQQAIDQQNAVLANFNELIKARKEVATLDTLMNWDFNVFVAVVGVAIGIPFTPTAGIVIGLVFGIASATYTSFYPIAQDPDYEQSVADIQATITKVNLQIGWLNSAIGLIQAVDGQVNRLVAECDTVRGQVATVASFWSAQQQSLTAILTALDDLVAQLADPSHLAQARADVSSAQESWSELISFMEGIAKIQYTTVTVPPPNSGSTMTGARGG